ncbi:MAG: DUF4340 domain-containing protein [Deltaproteobacteria bacterium]|nr:DUF4340 domain-containing protein [Deltaproteobacteria bacterium]
MSRAWISLLLALFFAAGVWWAERGCDRANAGISERRPFASIAPDRVARIEIEHLLDGVRLTRENGAWRVGEFDTAMRQEARAQTEAKPSGEAAPIAAADTATHPADAARVDEALVTLRALSTTSLASINPAQHGTYQVDRLGVRVRCLNEQGDPLASFVIGKQAADFFSTYLRIGEEDRVYVTREALQAHFPIRIEHWRRREIPMPPWLRSS